MPRQVALTKCSLKFTTAGSVATVSEPGYDAIPKPFWTPVSLILDSLYCGTVLSAFSVSG